ncbi:MAG: hypothetical protein AB7G13_02290 [Lautropia sp.]
MDDRLRKGTGHASKARKLSTAAEFELFSASTSEVLKSLTAAKLRGKVRRARTLRDKYTDLLRRQRLATRSATATKRGNSGIANARTEQKAELFGQVLARFDARLATVEAAERKAAERAERAAAKAAAKKLARKPVKSAAKKPAKAARQPATAVTGGAPQLPERSSKARSRGPDQGTAGRSQRMPGVSATVALRGQRIVSRQRSKQARQQARQGRG